MTINEVMLSVFNLSAFTMETPVMFLRNIFVVEKKTDEYGVFDPVFYQNSDTEVAF